MSDTKPMEVDLSNTVLPLSVDGPVYLTVEGATRELVVKCFMQTSVSANPMPVHIRFGQTAFGELAGGIVKLIEMGHITLTPTESTKTVQ